MPEGPSLVILKEELQPFVNKTVVDADGYGDIAFDRLKKKKIKEVRSHGKQVLILFRDCFVRIHLLMFGSYRINEKKETNAKLSLYFTKGEVNFYACSVKILENDQLANYDSRLDVMSPEFDAGYVVRRANKIPGLSVSDALMNQDLFAGVGNIIKNEVLFRTRIHPKSRFHNLPAAKKRQLAVEASTYSHDFYTWKKEFTLKKHWLIYKKTNCPRCKIPVNKEYLGTGKRRTYFCDNCQVLY